MIAAAPAVVSSGALTVLSTVSVLQCCLSALIAVLFSLHTYTHVSLVLNHNLLLASSACVGALIAPVLPAAMHVCVRMARDRVAEGSVIGLCVVSFRLAQFILTAFSFAPEFPANSDVVCWLPVALSAFAATRFIKALKSSRRIHAQDISHDKGALVTSRMNCSATAAFKGKDIDTIVRSERVLKKWAFGYLCLTFEKWKVLLLLPPRLLLSHREHQQQHAVAFRPQIELLTHDAQEFTALQRNKKLAVAHQKEFHEVSKLNDADVMDLRHATYDEDLQVRGWRCGVRCVRCVVCGVWCVVCGVWCVVCGVWCVV
jgi:hypothetical protein